ncbi:heme-dependent oxidative N-demethylase family protein [Actibacterium mucosum]|uniref:heme-dependent oxidative N-demethylase family protein n=1 Tax=Actibacterium mucosum TaxID=1087332 RepID=UPI001F1A6188|nr:DUF3445 domain-containing protein [Actibacterium mucosum]
MNTQLPELPWAAKLPGTRLVADRDWLRVSDSFAAQLAEKERLLQDVPERVTAMTSAARAACGELLDTVLRTLEYADDYTVSLPTVSRPDGGVVQINRDAPMETLARLCQEDFCILQRGPDQDQYHLVAASLCFPAGWRLEEKLGQPLQTIHAPVSSYTGDVARRVGRLFDGVQDGKMMERANLLPYADPSLFHPEKIAGDARFLRCERQVIRRLPQSGAVVFSIHTYLVRQDDLSQDMQTRLADYLRDKRE